MCLKDVRKLFRDLVFVSLLTVSLGAVQGEQSAEGQGWLQPSTGDIQRSHLVCHTPVWIYACSKDRCHPLGQLMRCSHSALNMIAPGQDGKWAVWSNAIYFGKLWVGSALSPNLMGQVRYGWYR